MKIRKITALIDTTGPDISGEEIVMLAATSHLVFERDVHYFQAHTDAFTVDAAVATVEDLIGTLLVDFGLDATPEELDRLDGASAANDTTGKAAVLGTSGAMTLAGALTHQVPNLTSSGVGTDGGGTIATVEQGDGVIHKTILTLTATPITLTDDAGVGQYGGVKLYDMPAGNIHILGAVIDADVTLAETWWTDTAEGDVGLGTTAVTDGNALATTEQNIIATTAIAAMTAQVGALAAQSVAALTAAAAGATDTDVYLNIRIDDSAAHMPDIVTNGAMASDTGWTKGTGWTVHTVAAGKADCDGTQEAVSDLSQAAGALAGVSYKVTYTVTRSAGTVTPYLGGTAGTARSTANTFTETIVAGADGILLFRADADFVGTIDDVTVTPLTGTGTITGTVTIGWMNLGDIA